MKKIHLIAGARPNFMKVAPLYHACFKESWVETIIVHTGQHYDLNMSEVFFQDLGLPEPHINLGVGSGSQAEQTGGVMIAYEKVLIEQPPDLVVVVGDVNSTAACSLAAVKLGVKVAHLEAGLRSFDRSMPEEINRVITDVVADYLWTPSPDADENLLREGMQRDKVTCVGNIMIDSLVLMTTSIEQEGTCERYDLKPQDYGLVTLHRPSNVDNEQTLKAIVMALITMAKDIQIVFSVHPRTKKELNKAGLLSDLEAIPEILLLEPLGYKSFMNLVFNCRLVITDSGGLQEETTYLGIPCLTLRPNTERPITISRGSNLLTSPERLADDVQYSLSHGHHRHVPIDLWDGRTADRVLRCLKNIWKIGKDGAPD